jgi:integrase
LLWLLNAACCNSCRHSARFPVPNPVPIRNRLVQGMPKVELTDRFCRSAKPLDKQQTDYFDTNTPGLALRVSPAGTRTWQLHYTRPADGRRVRITLGRFSDDDLTLAKARAKAREARGSIRDGGDPAAERAAKAAALTVADLVESYITRHADTKRSGNEIARRLRKNVADVIGSIKVADLHRRDLTRCIDKVKDRGAGIEANRVLQDLRAMVRWARARGDLDSNIAEGMRLPTETTERRRVLDEKEIARLWQRLDDATMRGSTANILRLCLVTAQRVGEVAGMTDAEIDLEAKTWTIPTARLKNGTRRDAEPHTVPLSNLAVRIISDQLASRAALAKRKRRKEPAYIFPAPGGRAPMTAAAVPRAVQASLKDLGIEHFTPHDLRRSSATHMEALGASPFVIAHVLNHVSATRGTITSRVYARHAYGDEKRHALDTWAARLEAIISTNS